MFTVRRLGIHGGIRSGPSLMYMRSFTQMPMLLQSTAKHVHQPDELHNRKQMTTDHDLPDPLREKRMQRMYLLMFVATMSLTLFGVFNYEKTSSPVMNATMYFLRRSELARSKLGKQISFAGLFPWVHGELNTMVGNVDINVKVLGDKLTGKMVLKLSRDSRLNQFTIHKWDLIVGNDTYNLLKDDSIEFSL